MNTQFERVRKWSTVRGLKDDNLQMKYQRFMQEACELHMNITLGDKKGMVDDIGDVLVTLINLADAAGLRAEDCLAEAFDEIEFRKGLTSNGQFVRYGKLDAEGKNQCDMQQGNDGQELFNRDDLTPSDFKK